MLPLPPLAWPRLVFGLSPPLRGWTCSSVEAIYPETTTETVT
ncbi:hypothetical protein CCUG63695_01648 [Mycobacteroides franklinii]|uniref:Uncharacterized protein n=1 Tax=Mycobacteroides franklinii TaxID=948102 RepID=A0A4R8QSV0_9MYCO|nr:hypothetical protein CCUG64054_01722 [Mycobacteroides franklinii]TDZ47116.1 hypothetical protein CCUG63697_04893 [Mycobacteroides franklinii]TDZ55245.1 hypothetical protein CCUG63696_01724 [Mycobacteroides franklinii]TDZ62186.1 hypothetical protein CCUG63695_01648 [Mycobacteroides franklinii]TDZ68584.1 hypothetical protein CCUG64056_01722 [Mycobacteroides franklinii]